MADQHLWAEQVLQNFRVRKRLPLKTGGHPYSDGCYGWLQPNVYGTPTAVIANQNAQGWLINGTTEPAKSKIDAFYNAVRRQPGEILASARTALRR